MLDNNGEAWERRLGVYGLCVQDGALLVVRKSRGPYRGRWDLPGGGPEAGEGLSAALRREVAEETGLQVEVEQQLGVFECLVPWPSPGYTHLHHVALFYQVQVLGGALSEPTAFAEQDSLGALWMAPEELTPERSSPLVMQAEGWLATGTLTPGLQRLDDWVVRDVDNGSS